MMKKETWKPVTIGGVTGILMGSAATYGVQAAMDSGATESDSHVVDYDSLSFKQAFEAARDEMGPGGVFTWHGNLYNTYTAAEWKAMNHREKVQFAERVTPQETLATADDHQNGEDVQIEKVVSVEDDDEPLIVDSHIVVKTEETVEDVVILEDPEEENEHDLSWDEIKNTDSEDVRILGFREVEFARGRTLTMEDFDVNGQRVAVIDVDKDGTPDYAMSDLNHNHLMDDGEVIDLHTGEELSFTNDDPVDNVPDFDGFSA